MERRWWVAAAAVAVVAVAVPLLWNSGLAGVQLELLSGESGGFGEHDTHTTSIRFGVKNDGWTAFTIVALGDSRDFMHLKSVDDPYLPITLGPGQSTDVELVYQVTDCDISADAWAIPVRVEGPWRDQTIYVDPSPQDPDAFNKSVPEDPDIDSTWMRWQVARASYVCDW